MGRGPNKSVEERRIITGCAMANATREECNVILNDMGYSDVAAGYWDMTPQYIEAMLDPDHPYTLSEHISGAPSLSTLKDMKPVPPRFTSRIRQSYMNTWTCKKTVPLGVYICDYKFKINHDLIKPRPAGYENVIRGENLI